MKFKHLTSEIVQSNLNDVFIQVNTAMRLQGNNWYEVAHNYAKGFSDEFGLPIELTAAIISVLSPQKKWYHNIQIAHEFLYSKGTKCRHVGKQREKACRLYHTVPKFGAKIPIEYIDDVIHGEKTVNFFHNIFNPYDNNYCTIDSHMIQIMTGNMKCTTVSPKQYIYLKEELIKFAEANNECVPVMQALLWVTWRIIKKS